VVGWLHAADGHGGVVRHADAANHAAGAIA
jgi:hypothetical protein